MGHNSYLASNITVPRVFHTLLPRKGIASIIDGASLDEAVCLVAPYGFGKTLAVISWLREHDLDAAWFTPDETDDSETAFLAGLSAAAARFAGWEGVVDDVLKDSSFISNPQGFLLERLNDAEKSGKRRILVIDNFRLISRLGLQRMVKNFVASLIGRWRVILLSRTELPPAFNDLMLKRHICLITPNELCFDTGEMKEFFSVNGCDVSDGDVLAIRDETEGWPASLNVVLTISRGGSVSYGEAAREYVIGFFETEIWSELDNNIREFLLKTSILDKLTPVVCNAVTDIGATLPVLRWLFVNGLFISRLDGKDTYRFHRVFRDFLRDKFSRSGIDEKELYKKLAWQLFDKGEMEQSFPCFFKAGDLYGLSCVLRILNPSNMGIEGYLEMTRCITQLDAKELTAYPVLVARMAMIQYLMGNIGEMHRLYDVFLEWIEPGNLQITAEEYAEYVWEAGWLSYINPATPLLNNRQHEEWCNYKEYVPQLKALHFTRAAILRTPSILRGMRDHCVILDTLSAFIKHNRETNYSIIREETSLLEMDLMLAEYAYECEDFNLAEELLRTSIAKSESLRMPDIYLVCVALLAKLIRAAHNQNEISALEARAESLIIENGMTFLLPNFRAFQLRNRLCAGQAGFAMQFEEENNDYARRPYFYLLYRQVTFARALLSLGRFSEAVLLLNNLHRVCGDYVRTMDTIEVNILRAIADYGLGRPDSAGSLINEALDEARKYGFIRIFSDEAKVLLPILEDIYGKTKDTYVNKIAISCKKTLARAGIKLPGKDRALSELTKSELKILKTLNVDMSYEEIALDNNIKVSTVKSHIHSIYSKLNVDNRTSAVMTAREMGIID